MNWTARSADGGYAHGALLCGSDRELLDRAVPFGREGLERGEAVIAAVNHTVMDAIGAALDGAATIMDADEWYRHPASTLRAYHRFITDALDAGSPAVRIIGEPAWPDGPRSLVREWHRYESVLNAVLRDLPVHVLCPYQRERVPASVVDTARRTHPELVDGGIYASDRYEAPERFLDRPARFRPPPASAEVRRFDAAGLRAARRFVEDAALRAGVTLERAEGVAAAASEVVTNAFQHGVGPAEVAAWRRHRGVVCQVDDRGPGIEDPLAGYRPPAPDRREGRGLWLARQLCDLVEIGTSHTGRPSVRLILL